MRTPSLALMLLGLMTSACAQPPQWLITIDTDARVPQFGDQLVVEVLDSRGQQPDGCAACRRILAVGRPELWPVSFGVTDFQEGPLHLRARLLRGDHGDVSRPYLDAVALLPAPTALQRGRLSLRMACFGVGTDLARPGQFQSCDPETGRLSGEETLAADQRPALQPDSWSPGRLIPCPANLDLKDDLRCVPGGAFVMGGVGNFPFGEAYDVTIEHLVLLSPFLLDRDEFTVGQLYDLMTDPQKRGVLGGRQPMLRGADPNVSITCAWLGEAELDRRAAQGDLTWRQWPLSCVDLQTARAACAASGRRLPTDAEWEWAAGNLEAETRFSFGDTSDGSCALAVLGRGRSIVEVQNLMPIEDVSCRDSIVARPSWRPEQLEAGSGDVTALGIANLGGRLTEFVEDDFRPYSDPLCFGPPRSILRNPLCKGSGLATTRGGEWRHSPLLAQTITRGSFGGGPTQTNQGQGFRCAKDL